MLFTILGSSGVIGQRLANQLLEQGHELYLPARDDPGIYNRPLGQVVYAIGVTADFRSRPFDTVNAHVETLAKILRRTTFESFLYLSSTRVYARNSVGVEGAPLIVDPIDPSDLYNLSKLMGESLCLSSGRVTVRVARMSNVVGGNDSESENFVPSLLRQAKKGHMVLRTALTSAKDYVHIDDVVELLTMIAIGGKARVYNIASGRQVSHSQWVDRLVSLTGCDYEVLAGAPELGFPPIDISLIREEFGFEPREVLETFTPIMNRESGFAKQKETS